MTSQVNGGVGRLRRRIGRHSNEEQAAHVMDADRRQQISRLYHEVLERPVDQRDAFLDAHCQGDEALRGEVESLLVKPAGEVMDDLLTQNSEARDGGLERGAQLGNYRIDKQVGRGGMGVVFLAHDTTLHRQVALKVLGSPSATARAQLLREARNAAALNHPNICTVYEVGEANGRAFIAMEYVDGRSLSNRLAESALPWEEAVRYGIEAADALAYAHEHGVVHRDLKAANAIITTTGRLKLVDFGLARREDALLPDATTMASLAPAGLAVGTPYSMAPEQVRGGVTDARTDIWELGELLYEMVSGAKPFSASTTAELFSVILRDAPAPLPAVTPMALTSVIERCLEKNPGRRYQRAGEVGAALEAIQAGRYQAGLPGASGLGNARPEQKNGLKATDSTIDAAPAVSRRFSRMLSGAVALILTEAAGTWLGIERYSDSGRSATARLLTDGNRASPNSEANEYYERALLFGGVGTANPEQAQRMIERALALDARFAAARARVCLLSVERILNGRSNDASLFYKAESEVRQALNDDPRCGRAHSVLALIYLLQGRKELVLAELDQALQENPADPTALGWSLNYHHFNGDYSRAQQQADQLTRQWPLFWPARLVRGQLLREQGDTTGAIREQERVLEQDPQNVGALASLARAYIDSAELQKARQTLDRARTEDRQNYQLRQQQALLLALEGKKREASQEMGRRASGVRRNADLRAHISGGFLRGHGRCRHGAAVAGPGGRNGRSSRGVPAAEPVVDEPSRASALSADSGLRGLPPAATCVPMMSGQRSVGHGASPRFVRSPLPRDINS
jgi:eukaryotic-like serine/threonine-protein kinase